MDAERPRACLGVGVHGSTLAFREGADLAHRSLGKGVGFGADDSDCQRAVGVSCGAGHCGGGELVEFSDVGEDQVDDFCAHGVAEATQRSICGEQVDDGEAGLLGVGDGPVDGREIVWRVGGRRALADVGLRMRVRRGRGGEARWRVGGEITGSVTRGRLPIPVQESDAGNGRGLDEDNQIGGRCGDDGR